MGGPLLCDKPVAVPQAGFVSSGEGEHEQNKRERQGGRKLREVASPLKHASARKIIFANLKCSTVF